MPFYTCDDCRTHDELERLRANTIPGLLKRLGLALLRLVLRVKGSCFPLAPITQKPRFRCALCRTYVDPKNVQFVAANYQSSDGPSDESFLGFAWNVTCHGETKTHYVSLVASMVGYCHEPAFEPKREYVGLNRWAEELDDLRAKAATTPEHERAVKRAQAEIAAANARRAAYFAENNIAAKLKELEQLIRDLAIVLPEYEKQGVITEPATDRIEAERVDAHRPNAATEAPGI